MATNAQCHDKILDELRDFRADPEKMDYAINGGFSGVVTKHLAYLTDGLGVEVELCPRRLRSAHGLWLDDLNNSSKRDMKGGMLDEFKHAGYLSFWLRRATPIIHIRPKKEALAKLNEKDRYYLHFLLRFGNEHLAFTLGYEICLYFVCNRASRPLDPSAFAYDADFVHDIHSTLKRKNMSPHAMNLIYRSLFMRREKF